MKNKAYITQLLDYFQYSQSDTMDFHAEAILSDYQEGSSNQSLQIKLLSVFGGILASLAFLGFLGITGLYESGTGLLFFGIVFITGAVSIKRDQHNIIIDTVSVGIFIIGYLMLGVGLMQLRINHNLVWFFLMIIAIITLIFSDSYLQSFLSVLIINASMFTLIVSNEYYYLIHAAISLLTLLMSYCIVQEARLITIHNSVVQKYNPIRIGLVLSFLAGLFFIGKKDISPLAPHSIWLSSVIIIPMIMYMVSKIVAIVNITDTQTKTAVYMVATLIVLPTTLAPAIAGAMLLLLVSFMVNFKTGLVLGIVSLIYFIAQYYYDLNFTLLTKSIVLFSSGILFIALYLFTHKRLISNEKV